MVGYAHARKGEALRARLDLSFLESALHLPWVTMVFLTGFIIEAMLAGRLWLQLNNEDADATGLKAILISVTDALVSPFKGYDSTVLTQRSSGVFEFSTLVAVEAYLIGTLAIVLAIVAIRFMSFLTEQFVAAKKRHDLRARAQITLQRRTSVPAPSASARKTVPAPAIANQQAVEPDSTGGPAHAFSTPAADSKLAMNSAPQQLEVGQ
jgi:uncharacterized membrane protein YciS (DUF1049 family)